MNSKSAKIEAGTDFALYYEGEKNQLLVLGQRQSSALPFPITSIQEDESGPGAGVEKQEEETEAGTSVGSPN